MMLTVYFTVHFYTDCGSRKSHPVVLKSKIVDLYNLKLPSVERQTIPCWNNCICLCHINGVDTHKWLAVCKCIFTSLYINVTTYIHTYIYTHTHLIKCKFFQIEISVDFSYQYLERGIFVCASKIFLWTSLMCVDCFYI